MTVAPSRINVMEYAGKDHLLNVVKAERAAFFDLIDRAEGAQWEAPTACSDWQLRDIAAHLVDVIKAYLARFALARSGQPFPEALGLRAMAKGLDASAKAFRGVPRDELIARLKRSSDELFQIFDALDAQQWTGELIPHVYMGPLPTFFYPAFQLMDYSVHAWDIRQGLGRPAPLSEAAATTLIPFMFILMQATFDVEKAGDLACSCGIQITGPHGGNWRLNVKPDGVTFEEGSPEGCPVVLSLDPNEFVLSSFQRIRGGVASGDPELAERFRTIFFKI